MKKTELKEIFGSYAAIGRICKVQRATVSAWPEIVPEIYQRLLNFERPDLKRKLANLRKDRKCR